ncbi:hypothetical protein [Desulfitobacterium sp.]|uniref:hypothetical protein n=1 Tax=Desulfitobacterium sp. TaxID=49981 RepID=UPI002B854A08|nr:hypothetical protein [Desulfitobacterium sp.]HVJ50799.1 hypothetical protein [Desulfitobacterium sp.]
MTNRRPLTLSYVPSCIRRFGKLKIGLANASPFPLVYDRYSALPHYLKVLTVLRSELTSGCSTIPLGIADFHRQVIAHVGQSKKEGHTFFQT